MALDHSLHADMNQMQREISFNCASQAHHAMRLADTGPVPLVWFQASREWESVSEQGPACYGETLTWGANDWEYVTVWA